MRRRATCWCLNHIIKCRHKQALKNIFDNHQMPFSH